MVPLIVAALRLLRTPQVRDNALLLGALAASVWVIHGLEALTALVVGGVLLATAAVAGVARLAPADRGSRWPRAPWPAWRVRRWSRCSPDCPSRRPPVHPERFAPLGVPASSPVHPHSLVELVTQTDLTSPVAVALIAAGVVALLVTRRMLWVLASEVILLLAMADALSWRHLARFWIHVVNPWGDLDRIVGVQYWLIPLLLGAGLLAVARALRDLSRRPGLRIAAPVAAAVAAIVVLLAHNAIARAWRSLFGLTVDVPPLGSFKPWPTCGRGPPPSSRRPRPWLSPGWRWFETSSCRHGSGGCWVRIGPMAAPRGPRWECSRSSASSPAPGPT